MKIEQAASAVQQGQNIAEPKNVSMGDVSANELSGFDRVLNSYQEQWNKVQAQAEVRLSELSPQSAELISVQRELSGVSYQTEVISRAADGLASAIRRIQQTQG